MSEEYEFEVGEKVLCYHGTLLYEAKCIKRVPKVKVGDDMQPGYKVHYLGWKKTYDEWLPKEVMMKLTPENVEYKKKLVARAETEKMRKKQEAECKRQELLDKQTANSPSKASLPGNNLPAPPALSGTTSTTATATTTTSSTTTESSRKRKRTDPKPKEPPQEEFFVVSIPLTARLERQLLDDWHFVTEQKRLVSLPRSPTVADILSTFLEEDATTYGIQANVARDTLNGLKLCFSVMLGRRLLYPLERAQYAKTLESCPESDLASKYGAEHLLRFISKLPELLQDESTWKVKHRDNQIRCLNGLVKYLDKQYDEVFLQEYDFATPADLRMASFCGM